MVCKDANLRPEFPGVACLPSHAPTLCPSANSMITHIGTQAHVHTHPTDTRLHLHTTCVSCCHTLTCWRAVACDSISALGDMAGSAALCASAVHPRQRTERGDQVASWLLKAVYGRPCHGGRRVSATPHLHTLARAHACTHAHTSSHTHARALPLSLM